MGTLQMIHPAWVKDDGTDRAPNVTPNVHPLRILATVAACIDTAEQMAETGEIETGEIDETARVIAYRVLTVADRTARAAHTWWHGDRLTGDTEAHSRVPDVMERVRAHRRTVRTNRGDTVQMVTLHGRAYVQGATDRRDTAWHGPTLPGECSMSADRARRALETVPRTITGADAVDVYRMTCVLFPTVPRLIGADVLTFHEFRAWDDVRASSPRKGYGTRYRLPALRARNGETVARRTLPDGTVLLELPAAHTDPASAWIGHRLTVRPVTVRTARAQRARRVTDAVAIRATDDVAHVLATVAESCDTGDRVTWTQHDEYGRPVRNGALTVTGAARRRFSVTGLPVPVRNYATADGLASAVARALAE